MTSSEILGSTVRCPHSCLLSRPNKTPSPSISSQGKRSSLWPSQHSSAELAPADWCLLFFCWVTQNWIQNLSVAWERWVKGDHHFPQPMGCVAADITQDTVGLLSNRAHWTHMLLTVCHGPQDLFGRAAAPPVHPHPALLPAILPSQGLNFAGVLTEFHKFTVGLFLQPVRSLWMAALPLSILTGRLSLVSSAHLMRV